MQTHFSFKVNGIPLDFTSMNVTGPKLFQVFTIVDGERKRFHLHADGSEYLTFALPDECPEFLKVILPEINKEIHLVYSE